MIGMYSGVGDSLRYHVNMRASRAAEVRVTILLLCKNVHAHPLWRRLGQPAVEITTFTIMMRQTRGLLSLL